LTNQEKLGRQKSGMSNKHSSKQSVDVLPSMTTSHKVTKRKSEVITRDSTGRASAGRASATRASANRVSKTRQTSQTSGGNRFDGD